MAKRFADLLAAYADGKRFGVYTKKGVIVSYHGTKKAAANKMTGTDFEMQELVVVAMTQLSLLEDESAQKPA